mgnify:CR=1 FL=1
MIRTDGFYLKPANKYTDAIAGNTVEGFIHWAYLFLDDGVIKRCRKETSNKDVNFIKEDFKGAYSGEYGLTGDVLKIVFDKGSKWEYKESFVMKSNKKFTNDDQTFIFHEWNE